MVYVEDIGIACSDSSLVEKNQACFWSVLNTNRRGTWKFLGISIEEGNGYIQIQHFSLIERMLYYFLMEE